MNIFTDASNELRPAFRMLVFFLFSLLVLAVVQTLVKLGGVTEDASYQALVYPLEAAGILAVSTIVFRLLDHGSLAALGFRSGKAHLLGWGAFFSGVLSAGMVFTGERFSSAAQGVLRWHSEVFATRAFVLGLAIFFFAAGLEELMFRGYPFLALRRSLGRWGASMVLSLLFMGVHPSCYRPSAAVVSIFLAGIFFTQLFVLSKSLWLPIGFHFGWNLGQAWIFPFGIQNKTVIEAAGFDAKILGLSAGAEHSWWAAALFFVFVVVAELALRKQKTSLTPP